MTEDPLRELDSEGRMLPILRESNIILLAQELYVHSPDRIGPARALASAEEFFKALDTWRTERKVMRCGTWDGS